MRTPHTPRLVFAAALALHAPRVSADACGDRGFAVHYAPAENLEMLDLALIDGAQQRIDLAGYILSDRVVIDALRAAQARGVVLRIVLDPAQRHRADRFGPLTGIIRMRLASAPMHLKSYAVDGIVLRTGAANLSASGLRRQDNDIVILCSAEAASTFTARFEAIWRGSAP